MKRNYSATIEIGPIFWPKAFFTLAQGIALGTDSTHKVWPKAILTKRVEKR